MIGISFICVTSERLSAPGRRVTILNRVYVCVLVESPRRVVRYGPPTRGGAVVLCAAAQRGGAAPRGGTRRQIRESR